MNKIKIFMPSAKTENLRMIKKKSLPKYSLSEKILSIMEKNGHKTMDFFVEKLNEPPEVVESALNDLIRRNKIQEGEVETDNGRKISLWMRKL